MGHMNYFRPYSGKEPGHEDQLTRAFLVLLRLVPLVHAALVDLLRAKLLKDGAEDALPPFTSLRNSVVQTQVQSLTEPASRLVSVLMTDEHWVPEHGIKESPRTARYDGVIYYPPEWALVIENKPCSGDVWGEQVCPSRDSLPEECILAGFACILWRDVIVGLNSLLQRELLGHAERLLVDDFIEFVGQEFPSLNPYTSFAVCKNNRTLLANRCYAVMQKVAGSDSVVHHRGYADYFPLEDGPNAGAQQIYLWPPSEEGAADWEILLDIWPADTINQARKFYTGVKREEFLGLRSKGWQLEPNMHYSFMSTNLVGSKPAISVEEYLDLWLGTEESYGQVKRENWEAVFAAHRREGLISEENLDELNRQFTSTARRTLNVCPGLRVSFRWPKALAESLDHGDCFVQAVQERVREALVTWGQPFVPVEAAGVTD